MMTPPIDLGARRLAAKNEEITTLYAENAQLREEIARLRSCLYAQESVPVLYSEVKRLTELTNTLSLENANLRAVLKAKQEPQGHQAERVAKWLREHGYRVTKPTRGSDL